MDKLLRADEKMFAEEEQWQTVSQLEVNEPGRHDALFLLHVPLSLMFPIEKQHAFTKRTHMYPIPHVSARPIFQTD